MNERIKELREALGLSLRAFGDRMVMSNSTISLIETGQRSVTDRFIAQICKEFGVNEEWIRTGSGDMFAPKSREEEIAELSAQIFNDENELRRKLIGIVADLSDDQIDVLRDLADKWLENEK